MLLVSRSQYYVIQSNTELSEVNCGCFERGRTFMYFVFDFLLCRSISFLFSVD